MRLTLPLLLTVFATALVTPATAGADGDPSASVRISPNPLAVTTFFNGASLKVTGEAPANRELAILVVGADADIKLKKKGKVWGLLWMNVGEAEVNNVPSVYLLATSVPVAELQSPAVRQANGIGLDVLGASRDVTGEASVVFEELIKLKKHEHLYGSFESSLTTQPARHGLVTYATMLPVPARVPEGSYRVELWGFDDANAQLLAVSKLALKTMGVTHDIAAFAHNHGLWYGICALIIALAVGLLTGLLFGLTGKGGH